MSSRRQNFIEKLKRKEDWSSYFAESDRLLINKPSTAFKNRILQTMRYVVPPLGVCKKPLFVSISVPGDIPPAVRGALMIDDVLLMYCKSSQAAMKSIERADEMESGKATMNELLAQRSVYVGTNYNKKKVYNGDKMVTAQKKKKGVYEMTTFTHGYLPVMQGEQTVQTLASLVEKTGFALRKFISAVTGKCEREMVAEYGMSSVEAFERATNAMSLILITRKDKIQDLRKEYTLLCTAPEYMNPDVQTVKLLAESLLWTRPKYKKAAHQWLGASTCNPCSIGWGFLAHSFNKRTASVRGEDAACISEIARAALREYDFRGIVTLCAKYITSEDESVIGPLTNTVESMYGILDKYTVEGDAYGISYTRHMFTNDEGDDDDYIELQRNVRMKYGSLHTGADDGTRNDLLNTLATQTYAANHSPLVQRVVDLKAREMAPTPETEPNVFE